VITLVAVGRGSQDQVAKNILSLGTNLLTIRAGAPTTASSGTVVRTAAGSQPTLTRQDAQAILAGGIDGVASVTVEQNLPVQVIVPGGQNVATTAVATDEQYPVVRNTPMAFGNFFGADEVVSKKSVVVLGSNVATNLFGPDDPTGQMVRLSVGRTGNLFTVDGVMASQGGTALGSLDDRVLIPITTAYGLFARFRGSGGSDFVSQIDIGAATTQAMPQVTANITALLQEQHKVVTPDFQIQSQQDALNAASNVAQTQSFLLGSIAGISLVVGGIGIMNTMLVSVTERTREIGIRRAVGARRRDIMLQFLVEAVLVCCFGGFLGAAAGVGLSLLVDGRVILGQTMYAQLTPDAVALSLVVSIGIGVFFGFYPASRAARLRPIEALHYE
jgi:putative ABC transport system permease protein